MARGRRMIKNSRIYGDVYARCIAMKRRSTRCKNDVRISLPFSLSLVFSRGKKEGKWFPVLFLRFTSLRSFFFRSYIRWFLLQSCHYTRELPFPIASFEKSRNGEGYVFGNFFLFYICTIESRGD